MGIECNQCIYYMNNNVFFLCDCCIMGKKVIGVLLILI